MGSSSETSPRVTAQLKKKATHLDILGIFHDLCQHVVNTRPFCNSIKPRLERSRVSGLRAENVETSSFWTMDRQRLETTFGSRIAATSHLTAYPRKRTIPSEVTTELHEWMDTFQMNPKAICADIAFHQPHDMQAFYRMHNVKRLPKGPHTPWPNRS